MYTNKRHNNWDEYLPYVTFAYNTVVQDSTKFAPFTLLYGYDAPMLADSQLNTGERDPERRYERLQEAREWARRVNKLAQSRQRDGYDRLHRNPPKFEIGDKVLVHRPRGQTGQSSKLRHQWDGVYTVLKKSSDLLYLVKRDKKAVNIPLEEWINVTRMKKFIERREPSDF